MSNRLYNTHHFYQLVTTCILSKPFLDATLLKIIEYQTRNELKLKGQKFDFWLPLNIVMML